jgi:hypothetical protein
MAVAGAVSGFGEEEQAISVPKMAAEKILDVHNFIF